YRMIPRVLERYARHYEQIARGAEAAGHHETARTHYWRAADTYRDAQHALFYDDHPEKIYLHGKLLECYDKVMQLADYPVQRVEIDAGRIGVCGISMGSFWGMRTAAYDGRVKALATASACFSTKRSIFEEASPRFKQMFMYMADVHDEDRFDAMADAMTMDGH